MKLYSADKKINMSSSPQFEVRKNKVYPTMHNPDAINASRALPWFEIKGDKMYSTIHSPIGHKVMPIYEIRNDLVHTTVYHPKYVMGAVYKIRKE